MGQVFGFVRVSFRRLTSGMTQSLDLVANDIRTKKIDVWSFFLKLTVKPPLTATSLQRPLCLLPADSPDIIFFYFNLLEVQAILARCKRAPKPRGAWDREAARFPLLSRSNCLNRQATRASLLSTIATATKRVPNAKPLDNGQLTSD